MEKARQEQHVITRTSQLKALRTPIRQQIIMTMEQLETCSVNELAPCVGLAPESLYYHIGKLKEAGLVRVNHRRRSGKRMESVYELAAPRIVVDPNNRSKGFLNALGDTYATLLRAVERNLKRALVHDKQRKTGPREATDVRQLNIRLKRNSLAPVRKKIDDLMKFIMEHDDPAGTETYTITTILNLQVPQTNVSDKP